MSIFKKTANAITGKRKSKSSSKKRTKKRKRPRAKSKVTTTSKKRGKVSRRKSSAKNPVTIKRSGRRININIHT